MKRIVWLGIGVAVGVYAYSKVRQVARQYTPAGVSEKPNTSRAMLLAE